MKSTHELNNFLVASRPHRPQDDHDWHVVAQAVVLHVDLAVLHVDVAPRPAMLPVNRLRAASIEVYVLW